MLRLTFVPESRRAWFGIEGQTSSDILDQWNELPAWSSFSPEGFREQLAINSGADDPNFAGKLASICLPTTTSFFLPLSLPPGQTPSSCLSLWAIANSNSGTNSSPHRQPVLQVTHSTPRPRRKRETPTDRDSLLRVGAAVRVPFADEFGCELSAGRCLGLGFVANLV